MFPGGEARALQEGAGFVGEHFDVFTGFGGGADHAERGSIAGCG
jgi:hypothetical protein